MGREIRTNDFTVVPNTYAYNLKPINPMKKSFLLGNLPKPVDDQNDPDYTSTTNLDDNFFPFNPNILLDPEVSVTTTDVPIYTANMHSPNTVQSIVLSNFSFPSFVINSIKQDDRHT
jgi:hypothetical protein